MSQFYIKIMNGLLEPKHCQAMGESIWLYMWLQDKCTSVNENGEGKVLGNKPIVFERDIETSLGCSRFTYQRWIKKLRAGGYIKTIRTPVGLTIIITKAKKYETKGSVKNAHHQRSKSDDTKSHITPKNKSDVSKSHSDDTKSHVDDTKSHIQYKTKQGLNKTIQNTKVLADGSGLPPLPSYGKPEINELFVYWAQQCEFNIESRVEANRAAASNLFKKYGTDGVHSLIEGVALTLSDQYAPSITDFTDLQKKLPALLVWGRKKQNNMGGVEVIS